jgi:cyclophilin family peptidyl-prolyl cis-trans isomerase
MTRTGLSFRKILCAAAMAGAMSITGCGSQTSSNAPPATNLVGRSYRIAPEGKQFQRLQFNLHPEVQVKTSAGEFAMQLDAESAPLTVDNFLNYVEAGYYDGTIFHQTYDNFIVLGGGYDSKFQLKRAHSPVRNEAHNGLKNHRGSVAMARQADAIDSATSQFFVNLADNTSLDFAGSQPSQYGYCVFGEVTSGMDVVERIAKGEVHNTPELENAPVKPVVIESIRRVK